MDAATMLSIALTGLSVFVGALISVITTVVVERTCRPHLRVDLADPNEGNINNVGLVTFLNLQVLNDPTPWWMSWLSRQSATDCWGTITFHREDGQTYFVRPMPIRWPRTPEPVPP